MQNSYLRLEHATKHPILAGLEDAPRIINGVYRVGRRRAGEVPEPAADADPVLSRPADGEGLSARGEDRHRPRCTCGRWARAGSSTSRGTSTGLFWEVMSVDHGRLLGNAIEWATNEERPVTVTGPGVLDVTVWRQKDSMTVHLVNLTNPMMMKGPIRELIPVGEQKVRVRLPEGNERRRFNCWRPAVCRVCRNRRGPSR